MGVHPCHGMAGGCAALEAARSGARVLVLERAATHGGTSAMAGGSEKVWPWRDEVPPAPRGHKVPRPGDTGESGAVVGVGWRRFAESGVVRARSVVLTPAASS